MGGLVLRLNQREQEGVPAIGPMAPSAFCIPKGLSNFSPIVSAPTQGRWVLWKEDL